MEYDISEAVCSWAVFWSVYWLIGSAVSIMGHVQGIRKMEKPMKVLITLIYNMCWTLVGSISLIFFPLRFFTDYNLVFKFLLVNLLTEIWFYHAHIIMHHPQLYKKLHKQHHEFVEPYALTAMYATPYEAVICNMLSVALPAVMLSIHGFYLYIWFALVAADATITHSGYTLGWLIDGSHDIHHSTFKYNYGTLTIFDRLYGTYYYEKSELNAKKFL